MSAGLPSRLGCRLTVRDECILQAGCLAYRVASARQISQQWFAGDLANGRRRLRQLVDIGWLSRLTIRARPLPPMEAPAIQWSPGMPTPEFDAASYKVRKRWSRRPVRDCAAYVTTNSAAELFGGSPGKVKNEAQATHDLGVTQTWMYFDKHHFTLAKAWRSEDIMAETRVGQKLPDAFIVGASEQVEMVVEFGGAYSAQRLREFHVDCQDRKLPYQIW